MGGRTLDFVYICRMSAPDMAREIPISEERILRTKSRGCCAMCERGLIGDGSGAESNLSEMAHIRGARVGSRRHDPDIDPDAVNKRTNLILLCPACHAIIDAKDSKYTVSMLEEIKSEFEARARKRVVRDLRVASFAELEVVAKWMATAPATEPEGDYTVTAPLKKIKKHGLSPTAQAWIGTGMPKSHLVGGTWRRSRIPCSASASRRDSGRSTGPSARKRDSTARMPFSGCWIRGQTYRR